MNVYKDGKIGAKQIWTNMDKNIRKPGPGKEPEIWTKP